MQANETLAAKAIIAEHRPTTLCEALQIQDARKKRGKRLDILGQEKTNICQSFGIEEIQDAKASMEAITQAD
jgi:hypothetical protein